MLILKCNVTKNDLISCYLIKILHYPNKLYILNREVYIAYLDSRIKI